MNIQLVFLGILSVIIAFYLKVKADGFELSGDTAAELQHSKSLLHYVFSILLSLLGAILVYLSWKPPAKIKPAILSKSATALYLLLLLVFIAFNYFLGMTLHHGANS